MFLVRDSSNAKTGRVAVTYAPIRQTCPPSCALRDNGCYAQDGHVQLHQKRLERYCEGMSGDTVALLEAAEIADAGPKAYGRPLRLHVSGDASSEFAARVLADAARRWNGPVWTYTHAWRTVPREAWGRVSVLASCERPADAELALSRGYAPALVVPSFPGEAYTQGARRAYDIGDLKLIPCPNQTSRIQCDDCRLCFDDRLLIGRRAAIGFAAHGTRKKRVLDIVRTGV